ncbi:hypothetical protein OAL59_01940 [Nitrosopumilus sp.]|nr:hypothetical protein [Nitrosopumilus sp.]
MDSGKNFDDQNSGFWCGCKNSTMIDYGDGETGCQKCGVILYENKFDTEDVPINQTQGNVQQNAADYTEENHGLGGMISSRDIKKVIWQEHAKADEKFVDHRLTNLADSYVEVKCNKVIQEIKNLCKKLRYSEMIKNNACMDYKKNISKHGFQKYKNDKILAGTCVLRVCKNSKVKVNISKVSETINEPRKKLVRSYNDVHKKISIRKPDFAINSEFSRREAIILRIHGMASILQIPEKLIRKNLDILDDKKFELIISGSDDESISAGVIEFICRSNNFNLKTKKIAKKFEISENAVRKQSKKIALVLNVKLEDKRKKSG